uniref:Uncharacterized protein n=1 Tax=Oryza rufipogon TaxID=4529 RepID=A0A0E0R3S2_ORYRU
MVFSPIPFQPDAIVATHEPPAATEAAEPAEIVPRTNNKESYILTSDHQKDVKAVEWRPNSGKMIAVGCKGGICLWSASYPGNVASVKSGVTSSSFGAFPRGSGGQWILVDILRGSSAELGANWDPEGRIVLLSFSNSTTLGSIHFSSKPPSLDAHLLPVEHPEISSLIVSRGIDKLAWDSSGERLALSFKDGNEMYHGLVAVYDVRRSPLVSVLLVAGAVAGVVRIPSYFARIDSLKGVSKVPHLT